MQHMQLVQCIFLGGIVISNAVMVNLNSKALDLCLSSVVPVITNSSSNFFFSVRHSGARAEQSCARATAVEAECATAAAGPLLSAQLGREDRLSVR